MGVRHGLTFGACTLLLACAPSCKQRTEPPKNDQKPPDHLAPDEVVESKERAFGLPLPRVSKVNARFDKSVHVTSTLTAEELANFVRARVKEGNVIPGATSTKLENVIPRDDAKKRVTIEVRPRREGDGTRSEMIVRDTTPLPTEPAANDEERWRKAGLTPSGQLLDPKHLQ